VKGVIVGLAESVNATSANLLGAVTPFMGSIILLLIGTIAPFVVLAVIELLHYMKVTSAIRDTTTVGVQSVQSMVTMAITSAQGMDITQRVLGNSQGNQQSKQ
jgi:hypothetical protein